MTQPPKRRMRAVRPSTALVTFALTYFDHEVRVRDIDRAAVQHFVDWLTTRPGRALGLRWSDLALDGPAPHLHVRRAIVKGATVAPKSRHGARLIPLAHELAATLRAHRPPAVADDAFVFRVATPPNARD